MLSKKSQHNSLTDSAISNILLPLSMMVRPIDIARSARELCCDILDSTCILYPNSAKTPLHYVEHLFNILYSIFKKL